MKKDLTKEEAIRRHRMMWEWIGEETLRKKACATETEALEFFGWNPRNIYSYDWCCEYAHGNCNYCAVKWPAKDIDVACVSYYGNGLYDLWYKSVERDDWRTAAYYALYISMLPERK